MNKIFYILLILGMLGFSSFFIPAVSAAPVGYSPAVATVTPPQLQITSTMPGADTVRALPLNSTGLEEYPIWTVDIYSGQRYSASVNSKVMETGVGPIQFILNLTQYSGTTVYSNITIGSTVYHFSDIKITGEPPKIATQSVSAISSYPGEKQYLTAIPGKSGELMYSHWAITLFASNSEPYSIYYNGTKVYSGTVLGYKTLYLNITSSSATVDVALGPKAYDFNDVEISQVPISKYYAPKPPPLVATALDVALSLARGMLIVLLSVISGMFLARKAVMAKMDSEPQRRL